MHNLYQFNHIKFLKHCENLCHISYYRDGKIHSHCCRMQRDLDSSWSFVWSLSALVHFSQSWTTWIITLVPSIYIIVPSILYSKYLGRIKSEFRSLYGFKSFLLEIFQSNLAPFDAFPFSSLTAETVPLPSNIPLLSNENYVNFRGVPSNIM